MIIFDFLINFIEAMLFSMFIAYYFDLKKKSNYIIFVTLLQIILLQFANSIDENGVILTIAIIVLMLLSIFLNQKKLDFSDFYMVITYNAFIISCAILASIIAFPFIGTVKYIVRCCVAKIIQFIFTILLIKKNKKNDFTFDLKKWGFLIIIEGIMLASTVVSFYAILFNKTGFEITSLYLISSVLLSLLFQYTLRRINKINSELVEKAKLEQLYKETEEKKKIISQVKQEISISEHRLYYMVLQLKSAVEESRQDSIPDLLCNFEKLIKKNKLYIDTDNPIFDSLYGIKINELILSDIDINSVINITKNDLFYNVKFVEFISNLLNMFNNAKQIHVFIEDETYICTIKFIYRDGNIQIDYIKGYLSEKLDGIGVWNIKNIETAGLRISIDMKKWIEKY